VARWLVRFAYDGVPFAGWARQPGARTIEGTLLDGLVRVGVVGRPRPTHLEVASRTDRGVSARGNAFTVESRLSGTAMLRALNSIAPEVRFTAATLVGPEFRVRTPLEREYRYFLPRESAGLEHWRPLLHHFTDRPIDVRSFARGVPADEPCWRILSEVALVPGTDGPFLKVRAPGFLWGMVRKIVAALELVGSGEVGEAELVRALAGRLRLAVPLAPPEPLVLWEVRYDRPWELVRTPFTRAQRRWLADERARTETRQILLPALFEEAPTETRPETV
jgi:tRNA pseudouridine38-40 synthase